MLYIVMELVNGSSLWQLRAKFGQAELRWGLQILRQLADALAVLHSQGIVHRDLKPENVLVNDAESGSRPAVKLADFGISILLEDPMRDSAPNLDPEAVVRVGQVDLAALASSSGVSANLNAPTVDSGEHEALVRATRDSVKLEPVPAAAPANPAPKTLAPKTLPDAVKRPSIQLATGEGSQVAALVAALAPRESGGGLPSRSHRELTRTGAIVGTPLYMAPELIQGSKNAQPAADIFSLGVIAFEVLSGSLPFERPAILARALRETVAIPSLRARRPEVSPQLAEALERCLATQPEGRPSAAEIAALLAAALVAAAPA